MDDNKTIKVEDLKQGDILLFSYLADDWESKLIALITKSPVSHSAMSYYTNNEIIEETPPNAQINPTKERVADRTVTVMRFDKTDADLKKVLDIAKSYVDRKEPYSKANLIFVGLYILLERAIISPALQKLLSPLLILVLGDLIDLVNEKYYPGTHPMVCSQFIYHCYEEAGEEYKLNVKVIPQTKCLLERVQEYINENKTALESKLAADLSSLKAGNRITVADTDKLLEEIFKEFEKDTEIDNIAHNDAPVLLEEDFVFTVHEFCSVINGLYNKDKDQLLISKDNFLASKPIAAILEHVEYFVTPGDLLTNCTNLVNIGTLI